MIENDWETKDEKANKTQNKYNLQLLTKTPRKNRFLMIQEKREVEVSSPPETTNISLHKALLLR